MDFPTSVMVTEQEVDISKVTQETKEKILVLAKNLAQYIKDRKKSRIIIGFAGPSGVGKSFATEVLKQLLSAELSDHSIINITIDAFHFPNRELKELGLSHVKGRWDTYDLNVLFKKLSQFQEGKNVRFPSYSRKLHEPIQDNVSIEENKPAVMLIEGLWLFYDKEGWERVRQYIDRSYYIDGNSEAMRRRTIERHIKGGRSIEEAERFYEHSDVLNAQMVSFTKSKADFVLNFE